MKVSKKRLLEDVCSLAPSTNLPEGILVTAYNLSFKNKAYNEIIRNKLFGKYLTLAKRIAEKFSENNYIDKNEIMNEAAFQLFDFLSGKEKLRSPLSSYIQTKIERKIKRQILDSLSENIAYTNAQRSILDKSEEREHKDKIDYRIELYDSIKKLSEKEKIVISLRFGLDGNSENSAEEIGRKFKICRGRVWQIIQIALSNIRNNIRREEQIDNERLKDTASSKKRNNLQYERGDVFYNEDSDTIIALPYYHEKERDIDFRGMRYDPELITRFDETIKESHGEGLSDLIESLYLDSRELSKFVRDCTGLRINRENEIDLFKQYRKIDVTKSDWKDKEKKLNELYLSIKNTIGMPPNEFIAYFNMSKEDFTKFVMEKFGVLREGNVKKIFELREVKGKSPKESQDKKSRISEFEMLENIVYLLDNDTYGKYFKNAQKSMSDRLKHALFPLYVNDAKKCYNLLERKIKENRGNKIERYFREVYDFFRKSSNLKIDRIKTDLDDFQKVDVLTLANKRRHVLASETGVGKSLEIIATAEYLKVNRVLIASNKTSTMATWGKEIEKHIGDDFVVITGDDKNKEELFEKAKNAKWVICNYETHSKYHHKFSELNFDMVVIDEADIMNNPKSIRTKAILNTNADYKFCVSGWIYKNNRKELWPILNWLYPNEYPLRRQFVRDYCLSEDGRLRLKYELGHKIIYRPKSMVLPDLKPLINKKIEVVMSPDETDDYAKAENNFVEWYRHKNRGKAFTGQAIIKLHSLRKAAIKPKFSELEKISSRGDKSVIFCSYLEEAGYIANELSKRHDVCYLDGQLDSASRKENIEKFNEDPKYKFFVMTEAGAKSIELISANNLHLFNPVWTYHLKKQITDRVHRRGQNMETNVYEYITRGTIEENISKVNEQKREEYEKTVIDSFGYTSWFEEKENKIIRSIIEGIVK